MRANLLLPVGNWLYSTKNPRVVVHHDGEICLTNCKKKCIESGNNHMLLTNLFFIEPQNK